MISDIYIILSRLFINPITTIFGSKKWYSLRLYFKNFNIFKTLKFKLILYNHI